jgi:hypothetical protein
MKPKHKPAPHTIDESAESEITIQPDGRVFAFGITGPLAAVLATIPTSDERMKRLLGRIRRLNAGSDAREPSRIQESESCPSLQD